MAYPDFDRSFVLHTDASQCGLGAILYQKQEDGRLGVIAYASRTLTPAEQKYHLHSGKLEFLALKWAICERFRDYLYYCPSFDVYTDNNPLTYILSSAKLDATRQRWVADLADFTFKIHYKPGKQNAAADTLSRMPLDIQDLSSDFQEVEGSVELAAYIKMIDADTHVQDCIAYCNPAVLEEEEKHNDLCEGVGQTLTPQDLGKAQDKDSVLRRVKYIVQSGKVPN